MTQVAKHMLCDMIACKSRVDTASGPSVTGRGRGSLEQAGCQELTNLQAPGAARDTADYRRWKAMEETAETMSGLHRHACVQVQPHIHAISTMEKRHASTVALLPYQKPDKIGVC